VNYLISFKNFLSCVSLATVSSYCLPPMTSDCFSCPLRPCSYISWCQGQWFWKCWPRAGPLNILITSLHMFWKTPYTPHRIFFFFFELCFSARISKIFLQRARYYVFESGRAEWCFSFLCWVIAYHKCISFKQHIFIISQFQLTRTWAWLSWDLCWGSHKTAVRWMTGLHSYLGVKLGKKLHSSSHGFWQS